MEEGDSVVDGLDKIHKGAESESLERTVQTVAAELPKTVDKCGPIHELDDSQLVGVQVEAAVDSVVGGEEVPTTVTVEVKMEEKVGEMMDFKRKRGRPPRGQVNPPPSKRNKEEEDVCFICFDGGSLVLCDRKSCPKAYHPSCIKRDEAFFRSKAKWNCGWHICSICLKTSHYMCYTCTYSLCKGCTKNTEYVCVRGNKGFCTACMRTVMLIENNEQGNKEMIQVDFDDKSSWEYLFKVYWIYLKGKLSLTLNELTQAKNPWKGAGAMACKGQSAVKRYGINDGTISVSDKSFGTSEANNSKKMKSNEQLELFNKGALNTEKPGNAGNVIPAGVVGNVASQVADGNSESSTMMDKDKTHKTRIKGEERAPQMNPDEYAAIDVHNINLIYLQRNLMECLIEDTEKFHDKVVGSMVRIRVSGSDQKQDMHRLVQVVGTSKVAIPYKIGDKTEDVMLEVFNLVKKEVISIDAISNQEFSEDECRRLRQSIRCGLVKRLTVGEIQAKAMELQAVRLNAWLETEVLRLNHLRDRASEKGRKKELRECIEKLQLLKTPEERLRRLREIPEVHADPKMDPNYDSEENAGELTDKKQDKCVRPRNSGLSKNGGKPISPRKRVEVSNDTGSRSWKSSTTCERSKNLNAAFYPGEVEGSTRAPETVNEEDECRLDSTIKPGNQVDSTGSASGGCNNQAVVGSGLFSAIASETSTTPLTTGSTSSANISEADVMWHYRDPNGKVQGPFSIVQLQKWSTTGLFPADMRIWTSDEHDGSFLLTDALNGKFPKVSPSFHISLHSQEVDVRWSDSMTATGEDNKKSDGVSHSSSPSPPVNCDEAQTGSCSQHWDLNKANSFSPDQSQMHSTLPSSTVSGQPHVAVLHQRIGHEGESWNSDPNHKNWSSQGIRAHQITGALSQENQSSTQGYLGQSCGQNWKSLPVTFSSNNVDSTSAFASFKRSTDSSGQNGNMNSLELPNPTPKTSNIDWERAAENKQSLSSDVPVRDSDISDRRSPTPKAIDEDQKTKAAENKQRVLSHFFVQDSGRSWSSASSIVVGRAVPEIADECGYSPNPAKASVEEWDSGFASVSSLKPPELVSDHVATPTSNNDQLTHSSPSHPAFNAFSWQAFVNGPIEFSTLAEESVSDLLAEVDAMESQSGLPSPTSMMHCGEELIQDSKNDCFSSMEELSPRFGPGKSDSLSSTGDIQLPCQSARADEQIGASQADVFDPTHRSSRPSTTAEMQRETKSTVIPVSQDIVDTSITLRSGSEAMDTYWGTMQGNGNLDWGGSAQGIMNMSWGIGQRIARGTLNMNRGPLTGPRDGAFHGVDSEFNRGKSLWSRQSLGGGSYSKPPSKGQQICEFYRSGHCMKGAFCEYLHP